MTGRTASGRPSAPPIRLPSVQKAIADAQDALPKICTDDRIFPPAGRVCFAKMSVQILGWWGDDD
jgi:hypothetical protein